MNPTTFTLADLLTKFQVVTLPVTLVCAGNRRKEQNIVQKSLGFSWGAGGLSTALFTGVYLCDILEYVKPTNKAKHVIFEGCDDLPNGPYGTRFVASQYFRSGFVEIFFQPTSELGSRQTERNVGIVGDERSSVRSWKPLVWLPN
jgi:DMSO/TMAO reductase YedYZ molybdopterin-dependent catalytic subunit